MRRAWLAGALCACWSNVPHRDAPPPAPNTLTAMSTELACLRGACTTTQSRWTLHVGSDETTLEVDAGGSVRTFHGARDGSNADIPSHFDEVGGSDHVDWQCGAAAIDAHARDADLHYRCDTSAVRPGKWSRDAVQVRAIECKRADAATPRVVFAIPTLEWISVSCGDGTASRRLGDGFRLVGNDDNPAAHRQNITAPDRM